LSASREASKSRTALFQSPTRDGITEHSLLLLLRVLFDSSNHRILSPRQDCEAVATSFGATGGGRGTRERGGGRCGGRR